MRNTLLLSVAAVALIAGAGLASAQTMSQRREAPSPAPGAQQSAPAEKVAPMNEPKAGAEIKAPDAGMKAGQADEKTPQGGKDGKAQRAQDNTGKSKGASEMKADGKTSPDGKTKADVKGDPKAGSTTQKAGPSAEKPGDAKPSAAGQGASPKSSDKASDAKPSTSGQGAAGAPANLSTEQRTTIRTVIKRQNVQPVTNVNFALSIGTRVPRTVHFYPVFVELVQIYPSWRGYEFFLVGDQIIVVNPRTLEIVAVLDV
jgi:hypothetical protein